MLLDNEKQNTDVSYLIQMLTVEVKSLRRELAELKSNIPTKDTFRLSDIARYLGVTETTLYKPWNLPDFGKPTIGSSPRRWTKEKVYAWYERTEADRRDEWEAMTIEQQAAYR